MAAFYRLENEELQEAPNFVYAPTYTLAKEEKDTYTYPTEGGWYWFNSIEEACDFFGIPIPPDPTLPQEEIQPPYQVPDIILPEEPV